MTLAQRIADAESAHAQLVAARTALFAADGRGSVSVGDEAAVEAAGALARACGARAVTALLDAEAAGLDVGDGRERLERLELAHDQRLRLDGIDPALVGALREAVESVRASPEPDGPEGWPIAPRGDIEAILRGEWVEVVPDVLERSDGTFMLYSGRVHSLAGEPGGGKTWVALHAVAQVLDAGGSAMLVDYEDRLDTAVRRLVALGADPDAICDRFLYVTPTFAIRGGLLPRNVREASEGLALVVVDSVGEALAHSELSQNDDGEVRAWMDATARRLADGGAAVLMLDHVTKDSEHRGRWAIGSQRKLAAIDGVAYMMTTTVAATKEQAGEAKITCAKDRLGTFQHGAVVAEVTISPAADDGVDVVLVAPSNITESGETMLTGYMERISKLLEDMGDGMSGRAIEGTIDGTGRYIRTALQQLHEGGWTAQEKGARGAVIHRLLTPFREADGLQRVTASQRVGTASGTRSERPRHRVGVFRPDAVDAVSGGGVEESSASADALDQIDPTGRPRSTADLDLDSIF